MERGSWALSAVFWIHRDHYCLSCHALVRDPCPAVLCSRRHHEETASPSAVKGSPKVDTHYDRPILALPCIKSPLEPLPKQPECSCSVGPCLTLGNDIVFECPALVSECSWLVLLANWHYQRTFSLRWNSSFPEYPVEDFQKRLFAHTGKML